jgi:nucleotide-binding universal stress UspA family protein
MFAKILCANDGSERALRALSLAIAIAKAAGAELHMVSVEEIDYMPEFIEEIREQTGTAARRFHKAHQRARALAEEHQVGLRIHLLTGHAVRDIVSLAGDLNADLL